MISKFKIVAFAVVLSAAAYAVGDWRGHDRGERETVAKYEDARKKAQDTINELGSVTREQADKIASIAEDRRRILEGLNDEIENDADTLRDGLSDDGMRRLERAFASP